MFDYFVYIFAIDHTNFKLSTQYLLIAKNTNIQFANRGHVRQLTYQKYCAITFRTKQQFAMIKYFRARLHYLMLISCIVKQSQCHKIIYWINATGK